MYYYVYNLQGDVTHILNSAGGVVGTYEYDAWGNILNIDSLTSIAKQNPFRYRGYYYDSESGLYYLNSRYYNAEWGRFLNLDSYITTGQGLTSYNMFVYCGNNPINRIDPIGQGWIVVVIGFLVITTVGGIIYGATTDENLYKNYKEEKEKNDVNKNLNSKIDVAPDKNGSIQNQKDTNLSQKTNDEYLLSTKDRVTNILIGAASGLAVGGAIVATVGAVTSVFVGSATISINAFAGATGAQIFSIGALAYNVVSMFLSPMLGISMEAIEWSNSN